MLEQRRTSESGFTLVEMIVVVAVIGILAAIVIPQLLAAMDRSRQRRSMADMANIARANGMYEVDNGRFALDLPTLQPVYLANVPASDGWGTAYQYASEDQQSYELRSLGKDGVVGPAAPPVWLSDPFEPDLIMETGQFIQMPASQ